MILKIPDEKWFSIKIHKQNFIHAKNIDKSF